MRRAGNLVFHVFDLLWIDGRDIRSWPLVHRRVLLRRILPPGHERIRYLPHFRERGCGLFAEICRRDLDGIVAKSEMSPYGQNWLKNKNPDYSQNEVRRELFDRFRARAAL
jgi:bifunctional non-homologous end joining protein LigD